MVGPYLQVVAVPHTHAEDWPFRPPQQGRALALSLVREAPAGRRLREAEAPRARLVHRLRFLRRSTRHRCVDAGLRLVARVERHRFRLVRDGVLPQRRVPTPRPRAVERQRLRHVTPLRLRRSQVHLRHLDGGCGRRRQPGRTAPGHQCEPRRQHGGHEDRALHEQEPSVRSAHTHQVHPSRCRGRSAGLAQQSAPPRSEP
ncbi:hypothetical protein DEI98_07830 [Curtobacterium sp. MCLR17_034]|nr:hypothetical protein DEI98_07830 [Curtobacterium sp. MCLR17_034]